MKAASFSNALQGASDSPLTRTTTSSRQPPLARKRWAPPAATLPCTVGAARVHIPSHTSARRPVERVHRDNRDRQKPRAREFFATAKTARDGLQIRYLHTRTISVPTMADEGVLRLDVSTQTRLRRGPGLPECTLRRRIPARYALERGAWKRRGVRASNPFSHRAITPSRAPWAPRVLASKGGPPDIDQLRHFAHLEDHADDYWPAGRPPAPDATAWNRLRECDKAGIAVAGSSTAEDATDKSAFTSLSACAGAARRYALESSAF